MNRQNRSRWISGAVLAIGLLASPGKSNAQAGWSPVGPNNASVFALAPSPHAVGEILVGTFFGGLYRTTNDGIAWSHVVSPFSSAPVFAVEYDPAQPGVIYVGTFGLGLFKSNDAGASWVALGSGVVGATISDVAVNPADSAVVLVASEGGVFRSSDAGASWSDVTVGLGISARTLAFDPSTVGLVYAGTRQRGVYRSTDGGQSWLVFDQGMGMIDVNALGFSPNGSALYAASNSGVFRLGAGETTWSDLSFDLPDAPVNFVVENPVDGRRFAATDVGVFVLDAGPTANTWSDWTARPSRLLYINPAGNPTYVASLGSEFVATIDNGQSFFDVSNGIKNLFSGALAGFAAGGESIIFAGSDNGVHVTSTFFESGGVLPWFPDSDLDQVVFVLAPHPTELGTLFAGTEGAGVWKSTDFGIHWSPSNSGIVPTRIFSLSQSPVGNKTLYAGTNAGLFVSRDDGVTWELVAGGLPASTQILAVLTDRVFPGVAYVSTDAGQVFKSIDDGLSFQAISVGLPGVPVLAMSAAPFGNLYAVTSDGKLWVSFNEGVEWFPTASEINEPVLAVAADPVNPFNAFVSTGGGGVYRSLTNGLTWEAVNVGLSAPFVFSLIVDPANADILYAGAVDAIFKSVDGGDTWASASTGLPSGFVQQLVVDDENSDALHAFVEGVGIYRSTDGGQQWTQSVVGAPFVKRVPLAVSTATSNRLFAGSDVEGVFASSDGGQTFAKASDGMTLFVRGLAISPLQPDFMLAGSLGGGIFRSTDGGSSWGNRGLDDRNVFHVEINPQDDSIAYAATSLGVVKTVDHAETFIELGQKASVIFSMVTDPNNREVIYIGSSAGNVFVSRNAGLTWARVNAGLPAANILALAIDASDGSIYAAAERAGVFKSSDSGASWQPTSGTLIGALQVVSLLVDPNFGIVYAAASEDGLYYSGNGGASWESIGADFAGEIANHLAHDRVNGTLYASALNQAGNFAGVSVSVNGGLNWTLSSAGLATESVESVAIDPSNPATLYAATPQGVFKSIDGATTWQAANNGINNIDVTRVLVDPSNPSRLHAVTRDSGVFRSLDAGASWLQGNLGFPNVSGTSLLSGTLGSTVYLATLTNGFYRSVDGGNAWLGGIEPNLAEPIVTYVAIDPQQPNIVYAAASGVGLLKTTNGGITWALVSQDVGNPFILAIAIDPVDPEIIYLGTSGDGVWVTDDGGASWQPLNDGLFNLNITSLLVDPADHNVLYVGTEGGGVFSFDRTPPAIDSDGDGVFDQVDCAPDDPALATIHTYYHDYDMDSFGVNRVEPLIPPDFNIETAVDVCELIPGFGLVPWTRDPWDFDGFQFTDTKLKGERTLGVDFNFVSEDGNFPDDELIDVGPDLTPLHIIWSDIETAPGVYDGPQVASLALANQTFSGKGLALSLTVSPIVANVLTVPADLRADLLSGARLFDETAIVERFFNLLTFIHSQLPDVDIASVQVGYEIDKLLAEFNPPSFWLPYVNFHLAAREQAKSLWGQEVPFSSIWSSDGILNPDFDPLRDLMGFIDDVVSLTYFPHHPDFTIYEPIEILPQLIEINDKVFPKEVYFQAVGYPTAPITGSSTTKQSQFLFAFFEFWDLVEANVKFVSFGGLHDRSLAQAEALADSPEFRNVLPAHRARLVAYLSSLGYRSYPGAGEHKSGYKTLWNHSFDRGWFRDVPRTARKFHMGFAQAPFDLPPDAPTQIEVFDWMRAHFLTDSDFSMVHLDGGVPWVEALADDFSSAALPYSPAVVANLTNDRDTVPAGNKLAVAINPLGTPRHLVAPYWGYGEGFDFDADFNRVPNGQFADADKRALPPPWDTYGFDTPELRIAFLKYAMRIIDFFKPDYLVVGIEVGAAIIQDPAEYEKYFELHKWLYENLKANPAYNHVAIMTSFSSTSYMVDEFGVPYKFEEQEPGVLALQLDAFERFMPYTDIIGLSHYPHFGKYSAYTLSGMLYDELFAMFERVGAGDKPIAITEGGMTADPYDILDGFVYTGTPEKQERHFKLLFRELQRHRNPVEFIVNFKVRDSDLGWQRQVDALGEETGEGSAAFVEFLQFFRDIGIYDGEGFLRPAGERWKAELALPRIPKLSAATELVLGSQSGDLTVRFNRNLNNRLVYSLDLGNETVLASSMGLTVDGIDLARDVENISVTAPVMVQQSYDTLGVHSFASTSYKAYTITADRGGLGDAELVMKVRVYDDAVAYRYVIPGVGPRLVSGEDSVWALPAGTPVWFQNDIALYEGNYQRAPLGTFDSALGVPVVAELADGNFFVLAEANIGTYSGMSFTSRPGKPEIASAFPFDPQWTVQGGTMTPWRVFFLSDDLNALVNNDVISSLNEAPNPTLFPQGVNTAWLRPGRALYSIWDDPGSGFDLSTQKIYVDTAAALGFEYVVVGPGWEIGFPYFGFSDAISALADLVQYAHSAGRDVDIIVWKPGFELQDAPTRANLFQALQAIGAAGVLADLFAAESQETNVFIETLLAEAAAHQLVVSLSNSGKPTGLSRTYPNLLAIDAVRGLEWNKAQADLTPEHNSTLPFTRLLIGPASYTPVTYDPLELGATTVVHQLATAGVFTSPLQAWSVELDLLIAYPEVLDMVQAIPSVWDETLVLPSRIADQVAMARRSGDRWFLFILNGSSTEALTIEGLQLSFLGAGTYDALLLGSDTPTTFLRFEQSGFVSGLDITVPMAPGSGMVGMFTPTGA